jgi:hypothetical protein
MPLIPSQNAKQRRLFHDLEPATATNPLQGHPGFHGVLDVFQQGSSTAHAWGRIGHRVISRLAEQRLTDKGKAGIAATRRIAGSRIGMS